MPDGFSQATEAAINRLDALMDGEAQAIVDFGTMQLAFVGLDIDRETFSDIAGTVSLEYGSPVIDTLAECLRAEADHFQVGYVVGQRLSAALSGAFAMGVLVGELHREQTIKREAASDD
jgi:hypothetical protein